LREGQNKAGEKVALPLDEIRRYCRQNIIMYKAAGATDLFYDGNSIPEKKLPVIKKSFDPFPNEKEIYFYCDTGALNNGKAGFMICEDGVYWKNHSLKPTNRSYLPWDKFKDREIMLKKYDLSLGVGDRISLAGMGRKVLFPIVEGIFRRIQVILKKNT